MNKKGSVLFVIPYPLTLVASQRFRFEQYFELLKKNGFSVDIHPFFTVNQYQKFSGNSSWVTKVLILIGALLKRWLLLSKASVVDFIFIHREASPVGPPVIEWFITKVLGKKIIYDFGTASYSGMTTGSKASMSFILRSSDGCVLRNSGGFPLPS